MAPRECEAAYRVGCLKNAIRGSSLASTRHTKTVVPALSRDPTGVSGGAKVVQQRLSTSATRLMGPGSRPGRHLRGNLAHSRLREERLVPADQRAKAEDKHLR